MIPEPELRLEIAERASALLERAGPVSVEVEPMVVWDWQPDLLIHALRGVMVVGCKSSVRQATLLRVIEQVRALADHEGWAPLVAVPYMTEAGATLCEQRGVGWLDASGNAEISAPGLYLHVRGEPNRYRRPGRPANVFAPRSSRLSRWLLLHPGARVTQAALASHAELDPGMTSRLVRRMEEMDLLQRNEDGTVSVVDPKLLLTSWSEQYRFQGHTRVPAVIAARSGVDGMRRLAEKLEEVGHQHAFTGLSAAWLYDQHAMFRLCSVYLRQRLAGVDLDVLGLHRVERGANVWLLTPDDDGVFEGGQVVDGVRCVHPLQAWLDLGAHPERATEAADVLMKRVLEGLA